MARRKRGEDINGLILLDKPEGVSSNHALQRVRRAYNARKAGHTGSLDPLATGLLPICLGEATKLSAYFLASDKHYRVTATLGQATTTGDAEGQVCERSDVSTPDRASLKTYLETFLGARQQIPPMYSALKVNGKPLYQYAREGQTVEREPRDITIHAIDLLACDAQTMTLDVSVSSGTYIRTLVEDMACAWGGRAHVSALRRTGVGTLHGQDMIGLERIEDAAQAADSQQLAQYLHPISSLMADWPMVRLDEQQSTRIQHGQTLPAAGPRVEQLLRLENSLGQSLGLGASSKKGDIKPKRLFVRPQD